MDDKKKPPKKPKPKPEAVITVEIVYSPMTPARIEARRRAMAYLLPKILKD